MNTIEPKRDKTKIRPLPWHEMDIKTPVMALDIFCKTWCIDKDVTDDLVFNCNQCEFALPDGKCAVKSFKHNKLPDYKDFGSMGDI
jgi:hypothetical protein